MMQSINMPVVVSAGPYYVVPQQWLGASKSQVKTQLETVPRAHLAPMSTLRTSASMEDKCSDGVWNTT